MSEPNDRVGNKYQTRIDELEKTVKALLKAIQALEEETGEPAMPSGNYYGVTFE